MASVKVLLNNRISKTGYYSLIFQLLHNRRKKVIYSPYKIREENFDKEKGRVVSLRRCKVINVDEINEYLESAMKNLEDTIRILEDSQSDFTVSEIAEHYQMSLDNSSVQYYFKLIIRQLQQENRIGTSNAYLSTLNRINRFTGKDKTIYFRDITSKFLNLFFSYLQQTALKPNTINFYFRIIRAAYNRAILENVPGVNPVFPLKNLPKTGIKTIKRAIGRLEIKKIVELNVCNQPNLEFSKDLFLFSFYCRGMPFVDMANLKHCNIIGNTISYHRSKTGQPLQIKITEPINLLIEKYRREEEYVLPIITSGTENPYRQYRNSLRRYNNNLKKLSIVLKLDVPLTSYVARHSWATIARNSGIPVSVISEGLGHGTEQITYTYLAAFDHRTLDDANERITNLFFHKSRKKTVYYE